MAKKKSTHGGARKGAGLRNKKKLEGVKTTPLYLDEVTRSRFQKIGDGEMSRGARRAAEYIVRAELFGKLKGSDEIYADDTYDGVCPECGGFAVFWTPDVDEYIKNTNGHYACENSHAR